MKMNQDNAIEVLTKMRECEDIDFCDCDCFRCCWSSRSIDRTNALNMAISALEGKDIDVPANSALDHIHNVVAENERKRGYEQAKTEYDAKLEEIKSRFKGHYYNKGYEQGKADAAPKWIPISERLPEEGQGCLVYDKGRISIDIFVGHGNPYNWKWYVRDYEAWMPLPESYKEE